MIGRDGEECGPIAAIASGVWPGLRETRCGACGIGL